MIQFQYTILLFLLGLVPIVAGFFFWARHKKKQASLRIGDPLLVKQLTANYKPSSFYVKFILAAVALAMLVLAVANLRMPAGEQQINRSGIDVMIALDVSKSMLARDVSPNRLERSKQIVSRLIDRLNNNRLGIVIFAGKAYLQMPLTADAAAAKMYISAASTESVPTQGTVIGDALKMCFASFNNKEKKYKAVVLITDGEDHDEGAAKIASEMASEGVVIYTVGMGSPQGTTLIDEGTGQTKTDMQGNTVISKLNENTLINIAAKGNGKYQLYQSTDGVVRNLYNQLSSMDQRSVKDDSLINYQSFFQVFLMAALILLLWELMISELKNNKTRKMKPAVAAIFLLFAVTPAMAQTDKELIAMGNEAYKKADYTTAMAAYQEALAKNPANSIAQYNLGNALYKSGKKEEAIESYDKALPSFTKPAEKADAHYNKGVVLHNSQKIPECIEAYKNALRLNPDHEDARQNLQKALQQQKQQQNQQDKQDKQEEKDKNKEPEKEPKPQPSRLTKKEAEEKLKALMQQEKNLQDKMHKVNPASVSRPEKDW